MNDSERLDYLDSLTGAYSNCVALRQSTTGRGWRLHETLYEEPAYTSVREAIDAYAENHSGSSRARRSRVDGRVNGNVVTFIFAVLAFVFAVYLSCGGKP